MKSEILLRPLLRLSVVLSLYVVIFLITGRQEVLSLAILGGGLFIASERLGLGFRLISLHFLASFLSFLALYVVIDLPIVFSFLCGMLAVGVLALTAKSNHLRTFGNWIFIPAVYVACDLGENRGLLGDGRLFSPLLGVVLIGPAATALLVPSRMVATSRSFAALAARWGEPNRHWKNQALTAFVAVTVVSGIALQWQLPNSQWMIWSALSVIAADLAASRAKFKDRVVGALAGCPLGFLAGLAVPHDRTLYAFATLAILLTLVGLRTYRLAFGMRCGFTAFAAVVAGGSVVIAEERVLNVFIGGLTGIVLVHIAEWFAHKGKSADRREDL